jgi:hypothetical protein
LKFEIPIYLIGNLSETSIKTLSFSGSTNGENHVDDQEEAEPYCDVYDYMKAFMAERKIK